MVSDFCFREIKGFFFSFVKCMTADVLGNRLPIMPTENDTVVRHLVLFRLMTVKDGVQVDALAAMGGDAEFLLPQDGFFMGFQPEAARHVTDTPDISICFQPELGFL